MKLSALLPKKCPKSITWGQRWSYEGSSQRLSGTLLPPSPLAFLPLSWDKHSKVLFLHHSPLAWWAQWLLLYQWSHQHIFELGLYLERKEQSWFLSLQIADTATIRVYPFPLLAVIYLLPVQSPGRQSPRHFNTRAFRSPTFGAVVVSVQVTVLRLLLPAHDVVGEVPIGKRGRVPFHNQLG